MQRCQSWWKVVSFVQPTPYMPRGLGEPPGKIWQKNVQQKNHDILSENKFPRERETFEIIHAPGFRWTILNLQMLVLSCLAPPEVTTTVKIYSLFCSVSFQDTIWPFTRQSWAACGTSSKPYMAVFSISFNIVKLKTTKGGKIEGLLDFFAHRHWHRGALHPCAQRGGRCHPKGFLLLFLFLFPFLSLVIILIRWLWPGAPGVERELWDKKLHDHSRGLVFIEQTIILKVSHV